MSGLPEVKEDVPVADALPEAPGTPTVEAKAGAQGGAQAGGKKKKKGKK
jgi:hypothetical protein